MITLSLVHSCEDDTGASGFLDGLDMAHSGTADQGAARSVGTRRPRLVIALAGEPIMVVVIESIDNQQVMEAENSSSNN